MPGHVNQALQQRRGKADLGIEPMPHPSRNRAARPSPPRTPRSRIASTDHSLPWLLLLVLLVGTASSPREGALPAPVPSAAAALTQAAASEGSRPGSAGKPSGRFWGRGTPPKHSMRQARSGKALISILQVILLIIVTAINVIMIITNTNHIIMGILLVDVFIS